jgi:hypothetical protein
MKTERLTAEKFWENEEKDFIKAIGLELMKSDKLYLPHEVWAFMEAFAAQEVEPIKKQRDELKEALKNILAILDEGQELNMCNYNHEDVAALNKTYVEACLATEDAITNAEEK